jgi:GTP cyclohydrolase IA
MSKAEELLELINQEPKPSRKEAEEAVRVLIKWAGDDPEREGLVDTPRRVVESYEGFFSGYNANPDEILSKNFSEVEGFDDMIILKQIKFTSFCEHHILPIIGYVDIAYIPNGSIVGISKIARIVDVFAKRLQMQERFTVQIAQSLNKYLKPQGVAVSVIAQHQCMSLRGVKKETAQMQTNFMLGAFDTNLELRKKFLSLISKPETAQEN